MIHGPNLLRRLFHTPPYTLSPLTQWNIRLPTSSSLLMPILEDFAHLSLPPTSCTSCEVWVRSGVARLHFGSWPVLWAILFPSKAYKLRSRFMFIPVILFTALGRYTFCSLKKKFLCGNSEIPWNCPFSLVLVNKQATKTSPKEGQGECVLLSSCLVPLQGAGLPRQLEVKRYGWSNALQGTWVVAISSIKSWGWHSVFTKILFTGPSTTSELKRCNFSNPFFLRILTKACVGYFSLCEWTLGPLS